jgi:hypothetical protein
MRSQVLDRQSPSRTVGLCLQLMSFRSIHGPWTPWCKCSECANSKPAEHKDNENDNDKNGDDEEQYDDDDDDDDYYYSDLPEFEWPE